MRLAAHVLLGICLLAGVANAQKKASEVFKNVVVLRDASQPQFMSAMSLISGSLGVGCLHCHELPYDRDTKEAKITARKMIRMTADLNATNFGGKNVVTCNTCHQGSLHPTGLPALWEKASPKAAPKINEPLPAFEEVAARYRKAVGEAEAKSIHLEGFMTTGGDPRARPFEIDASFPEQFVLNMVGAQTKMVRNGAKVWVVAPRAAQEVPLEQARAIADLFQPVKRIDQLGTATVTGIEQIEGRLYVCVDSTTATATLRLYFDKSTGLLYKARTETVNALGVEPSEILFEDYTIQNGIKMPNAITNRSTIDRVVYRFSKIEPNAKVDPAKFELPPAK
jgi:outer membrane lipoprotein-sorting protein